MKSRTMAVFSSVLYLSLLLPGCDERSDMDVSQDSVSGRVAATADEARPLIPGLPAPSFELHGADGRLYSFDAGNLERPTVIVFYRGGWCPYCNRQLSELRLVEEELASMGYDMLFLSADRHEILRPSLRDTTLVYTLLSDNTMEVARAYGVAFRVDDTTIERYLSNGLDLAAASGHPDGILPIPAVFIVTVDGLISFMYANPDYRVRTEPELLLTAARLALE